MRYLLRRLIIFVFVLMQFQGVIAAWPALRATAQRVPEETMIVDNAAVKVTVNSTREVQDIAWRVKYKRYAGTAAAPRAMRLRFAQDVKGNGTVVPRGELLLTKPQDDRDWYREKPSATETEGGFTVTTPADVENLVVWVQVDEYAGLDGTATPLLKGVLAEDAEPVVVPAPPEKMMTDSKEHDNHSDAAKVTVQETGEPTLGDSGTHAVVNDDKSVSSVEADDDEASKPSAILNHSLTKPKSNLGMSVLRAGATVNRDPFHYTDDDAGHYPTNGTHDSLNGTSQAIKNYDYGTETSTDDVLRADITGKGLTFGNGYHAYKDGNTLVGYTKKTIQEVSANRYKVQLDMIGDAIKTYPDVDIVLVLDRSSSMMETTTGKATRWSELQAAVRSFSTNILANSGGHIRIGMAGFGGNIYPLPFTPYARIASFGTISNGASGGFAFNGFTTSASTLQKHSLLTENPHAQWSGTPTFLGLDAGLHLLKNKEMGARDGVKKVLITITDGLPTFWPGTHYSQDKVADALGNAAATKYNGETVDYTLRNITTDLLVNRRNYYNTNNSGGVLLPENATSSTTLNFINKRLGSSTYRDVDRFAIGFYQGTQPNGPLLALGPDGTFSATNLTELMNALDNITHDITATIVDAVLRDPLSEYVEFQNTAYTVNALTLKNGTIQVLPGTGSSAPQYAQKATVTRGNDGFTVSHLTLGGADGKQYGYRLTYEVKLKTKYQDGQFYPANGVTSLENNVNSTKDYLHFAVPSVRHTGTDSGIEVIKNWVDDDNKWGTRKAIKLQLQRRKRTTEAWVNYRDPRTLAPDQTQTIFPGVEYGWKESQPTSHGNWIYRVVETTVDAETFVPGYKAPTYTADVEPAKGEQVITVTNELKKTNYTFYKVDEDHQPLADAEFTVTRHDDVEPFAQLTSDGAGKVTVTGMPIGRYVVTETKAPAGYDGGADFELVVEDNGADALKITGAAPDYQVVNKRITYGLELLKLNQDGHPLKNAYFRIKGPSVDTTGVTAADGRLVLEKPITNLQPGEYTIEETKAPVGYIHLKGTFTLTISDDYASANLAYDGNELAKSDYGATIEREPDKSGVVTLTIKNHQREAGEIVLPLSGGAGIMVVMILGTLVMGAAVSWWYGDYRSRVKR